MSKQTEKNQVFEKENRIFSYSKSILSRSHDEISPEEFRREYEILSQSYGELLGEVKLLTSVSDRLQNKLNRANEGVLKKTEELKENMDVLTRARVGRQATTIVLVIALIFFLISEWMVDPNFGPSDTSLLFGKIIFALLLKPMQMFLENMLLKSEKRTQQD